MTDILHDGVRKFKNFLQLLIEKNTRYGIIFLQLADTEGTVDNLYIKPYVGDWGKAGCNKTEKELTDYEVHN